MECDLIFPGREIRRHIYLSHLSRYMYAGSLCHGKDVLEIGCGVGYGSSFLCEKGANKVIGIDINDRAIDIARSYFQKPKLKFVHGDMQALPFEDNSFHVVISFGSLDHVTDASATLTECKRVLRRGGTFIASLLNKEFITPPFFKHPLDPVHQKEFSCDELTELVGFYFSHVRLFGETYRSKQWWWVYMILRELVYNKFSFTQPVLGSLARLFFASYFQLVAYDERTALADSNIEGIFHELLTGEEKHSASLILVTAVKP